ncbi:MAG: hypothetical protein ABL917_00585 [Parcubacteria group bacterium]
MNILSKDIVKEWGLSALSQSKQVEVLDSISRTIYQAVLVRSLDLLNEDEEKELDDLLDVDATTPDEVMAFLKKRIKKFTKILEDERQNVKDHMKADVLMQ